MGITTHVNPAALHSSPAFTQAVRVAAAADLVYVGGQNGVDSTGAVVGPDLASQTRQALINLQTCLAAAGAGVEDVVKWTILIREGESLQDGFAAFAEVWGQRPNPPAIDVVLTLDEAQRRLLRVLLDVVRHGVIDIAVGPITRDDGLAAHPSVRRRMRSRRASK